MRRRVEECRRWRQGGEEQMVERRNGSGHPGDVQQAAEGQQAVGRLQIL
jgi:hypothetical protein